MIAWLEHKKTFNLKEDKTPEEALAWAEASPWVDLRTTKQKERDWQTALSRAEREKEERKAIRHYLTGDHQEDWWYYED